MRNLVGAHIKDLWNGGGPFTASSDPTKDGKPNGVVTVEIDSLSLHETSSNIGIYSSRGSPLRYFVRTDVSPTEKVIPGVTHIQIDGSSDQDARTCTITMYNQKMLADGQTSPVNELGQPGYYTSSRGSSSTAAARWGQSGNEWRNVLVPNAIMRTRQGYGGQSKTWQQAEADGNIVLTGIWFIDTVTTHTDGTIVIKARDPMKLLLEQQLYPPLLPRGSQTPAAPGYPLKYFYWSYFTEAIRAVARDVNGLHYDPIFFGADSAADGVGYVISDGFMDVDAFGDARHHDRTGGMDPADPNSTANSIRSTKSGNGYYVLNGDGQIVCYGDAVDYGDPYRNNGYRPNSGAGRSRTGITFDFTLTHTGNGYWVLDSNGHTYNFGDAPHLTVTTPYGTGDVRDVYENPDMTFLSIDANPTAYGFIVIDHYGLPLGFGNHDFHGGGFTDPRFTPPWPGEGGIDGPQLHPNRNPVIRFRYTPTGQGYYMMTAAGQVRAFGDAVDYGSIAEIDRPTLENFDFINNYWGFILQANGGYLVLRGDGVVTPFNTTWWGDATPGGRAILRTPGNYSDYADIIKDLALWSGFLLAGTSVSSTAKPPVYGNIESTGAYYPDSGGVTGAVISAGSPDPLPDAMFDKRPVIDPMHQIKEIVAYDLRCDDEGALRFESPNIWGPGNFNEVGTHVAQLPEIDERVQLTDYSITFDEAALRSEIIISSENPDDSLATTVTTRLIPSTVAAVRGLIKPAMWVDHYLTRKIEQEIMAELIALRIYMSFRTGTAKFVANPLIGIGDQVRIYERQTGETFTHFIKSLSSTMDLNTGEYMMTIQTHWLGSMDDWAITAFGGPSSPQGAGYTFRLSQQTTDFLAHASGIAFRRLRPVGG